MMKSAFKHLVMAASFALAVAQAQAAILAQYNFNGSNGNSSDSDALSTAGTFGQTGLTVSYGDPNFATGDTIGIRASASSIASTLGSSYYSFTITPNSGYRANLSGTAALTFQYARTTGFGGGNQFNWAVRSSLDNYTGNLATGATTGSGTWLNGSVNLGSQFALQTSSAVTFRIYVWDGSASGNTTYGYLDNVVLNGAITAVPEPTNIALGIFAAVGSVGMLARSRKLRTRLQGWRQATSKWLDAV